MREACLHRQAQRFQGHAQHLWKLVRLRSVRMPQARRLTPIKAIITLSSLAAVMIGSVHMQGELLSYMEVRIGCVAPFNPICLFIMRLQPGTSIVLACRLENIL